MFKYYVTGPVQYFRNPPIPHKQQNCTAPAHQVILTHLSTWNTTVGVPAQDAVVFATWQQQIWITLTPCHWQDPSASQPTKVSSVQEQCGKDCIMALKTHLFSLKEYD